MLSLTICIVRKCRCLINRRFEPGSICYETDALTSRPTKQLVISYWIYDLHVEHYVPDIQVVINGVICLQCNAWCNYMCVNKWVNMCKHMCLYVCNMCIDMCINICENKSSNKYLNYINLAMTWTWLGHDLNMNWPWLAHDLAKIGTWLHNDLDGEYWMDRNGMIERRNKTG